MYVTELVEQLDVRSVTGLVAVARKVVVLLGVTDAWIPVPPNGSVTSTTEEVTPSWSAAGVHWMRPVAESLPRRPIEFSTKNTC